ncbi:hypothetical protein NDU88_001838 [Pleurodeles waltl]|uniref:Uncharacterized protein n=1 Tax=Pleurodeles waltl TaxID=8319 RepID=A0AAV7VD19_PLEWA|nr:hypothetical protein NDU88_001838 [Pleurodeles waltl]
MFACVAYALRLPGRGAASRPRAQCVQLTLAGPALGTAARAHRRPRGAKREKPRGGSRGARQAPRCCRPVHGGPRGPLCMCRPHRRLSVPGTSDQAPPSRASSPQFRPGRKGGPLPTSVIGLGCGREQDL